MASRARPERVPKRLWASKRPKIDFSSVLDRFATDFRHLFDRFFVVYSATHSFFFALCCCHSLCLSSFLCSLCPGNSSRHLQGLRFKSLSAMVRSKVVRCRSLKKRPRDLAGRLAACVVWSRGFRRLLVRSLFVANPQAPPSLILIRRWQSHPPG